MKRKVYPAVDELVIAKIVSINPHSALAELQDYDHTGMIHISEVSNGWVKDIRRYVKSGQIIVARVLKIDEERGHVSLSIKRVSEKQQRDKLLEDRQENRAQKMLEQCSILLKADKKEVLDIRRKLVDKFGSLFSGFEIAAEDAEKLKESGIPEKWAEVIKELAGKNLQKKEFTFKAHVMASSTEPDGVEGIRTTMLQAKALGLEVQFISSPEYRVSYTTAEAKKGAKNFDQRLAKLEVAAKSNKVELSVEKI